MACEIREMTRQDVPLVADLEQTCFSLPWSRQSLEEELSNPLSLWLTAWEDGWLAGYIGSQSVLGEADMMNLAVDGRFRRRGIGRELVQALVQALTDRQVSALTLEVRASNDAALALYRSLGFLTVGRRPGYYARPREDAVIMRKEWKFHEDLGN